MNRFYVFAIFSLMIGLGFSKQGFAASANITGVGYSHIVEGRDPARYNADIERILQFFVKDIDQSEVRFYTPRPDDLMPNLIFDNEADWGESVCVDIIKPGTTTIERWWFFYGENTLAHIQISNTNNDVLKVVSGKELRFHDLNC